MPISLTYPLRRLDKDEFRQLDYAVMSHAFASQNELGRLCEEAVYQQDLAIRIQEAGLGPAKIEFPISISHKDFSAAYSADLVVADAAIYELKTVESEFVNSALTFDEQREHSVDSSRWNVVSDRCQYLQTMVADLTRDWGVFLETSLYASAVTHLLGGGTTVLAKIPMTRDGHMLGTQPVHLLTPDVAFRITALKDNLEYYDSHLCRFLRHTELRAIQWVNLCNHVVQWVTIHR